MKLYYYQHSERKGPVASVTLRALESQGEIEPTTIVENEFGRTAPAARIGELVPGLSLEKYFAQADADALDEPSDALESENDETQDRSWDSDSTLESDAPETEELDYPEPEDSAEPILDSISSATPSPDVDDSAIALAHVSSIDDFGTTEPARPFVGNLFDVRAQSTPIPTPSPVATSEPIFEPTFDESTDFSTTPEIKDATVELSTPTQASRPQESSRNARETEKRGSQTQGFSAKSRAEARKQEQTQRPEQERARYRRQEEPVVFRETAPSSKVKASKPVEKDSASAPSSSSSSEPQKKDGGMSCGCLTFVAIFFGVLPWANDWNISTGALFTIAAFVAVVVVGLTSDKTDKSNKTESKK